LLELPADDDSEDLDSLDVLPDDPVSLDVTFFLPPDLKSVSYHPPPFKRKPAAEILFFRLSVAHAGHFTSGGSLTFCRTSTSWPQFAQRYSYIGILSFQDCNQQAAHDVKKTSKKTVILLTFCCGSRVDRL